MRKHKLLVMAVMLGALSISGCSLLPQQASRRSKSSQTSETEIVMPEAYQIYQLYLSSGGTLTYEEWLESVRGEPGQDGHSPTVTIGNNGHWYIDGKDTGINAQGQQGERGAQGDKGDTGEKGDTGDKGDTGEKGDDGKSAYEQYLESHPDYTKSEEEWLDDLLNGRLATVVSHTVSFNSNGGSEVSSQQIYHGEKVSKPADPVKAGYTFEGWYYNDEPWSFSGHVVTSDMVIEARWKAVDYTVTFKNEDGTVLETIENVHYGDRVVYSGETPVKPNPTDHYLYEFTGWDQNLIVNGDMEFVAQYNEEFVPFEETYLDANDNVLYRHFVRELNDSSLTINYQGVDYTDGNVRFEAEDGTFVGQIDLEEHDDCSNGKSIGGFSENEEIIFNFNCSKSGNADLVFNFAIDCGVGMKINDRMQIFVNGSQIDLGDDVQLLSSQTWTDWELVNIGSIPLKGGQNTITLCAQQYINIDYMELHASGVFNPIDAGVEIPTKPTENDVMYQFRGWVEDSRTSDTVIYKPAFDSCTDGLSFEGNEVYYYEGTAKEVHVPAHWNGKNIRIVSRRAFEGKDVEKVILADGITRIEECAFRNCPNLKEVVFPSTLTLIRNHAFEYCSSLEVANIPEGVTDVEYRAFAECISLKTLNLPSTLTVLRNDCFWNCRSLTSVVVPENCTCLESGCFLGCSLLKELVIPEGVTSIGNGTFADCKSLISVNLPSTLESIAGGAFRNCDSLSYICIPISVTRMEDNIFSDDNALTIYVETDSKPKDWSSFWNWECPIIWSYKQKLVQDGYTYTLYEKDGIKYADVVEFDHSITSFQTPEVVNGYQVVSIGSGIFKGHENLTSVILPTGVTSITADCFSDCTSLQYNEYGGGLYLGAPNNPYFACIKAVNKDIATCEMHSDCRVIAKEAFRNCNQMTSLTLNEGLTTIPYKAFENCGSIQTVTIPSTVKTLGQDAFNSCTSLRTVNVSEGLETIGISVFNYCYSLQSFTVPSTVTSIGHDCFSQCYGLKTFTFLSPNPPAIGSNLIIYRWGNDELKIIVPKGSLEAYQNINDDSWRENALVNLIEADD